MEEKDNEKIAGSKREDSKVKEEERGKSKRYALVSRHQAHLLPE